MVLVKKIVVIIIDCVWDYDFVLQKYGAVGKSLLSNSIATRKQITASKTMQN